MNFALILGLVFIIVLLIVFSIFSFKNLNEISSDKEVYVLNLQTTACYPQGSISNLIETNNLCCVVDGKTTTTQIVPSVNPSNMPNMLIDITAVPASDACVYLCQKYNQSNGTCLDTDTPYNACLFNLKSPDGCPELTIPVAQNNGTPYFVTGPYTLSACPATTKC